MNLLTRIFGRYRGKQGGAQSLEGEWHRKVDVPQFNEIEAGGAFNIRVVPGDSCTLAFQAEPAIINMLSGRVAGNRLILAAAPNLVTSELIVAEISMPLLLGIDLSGGAKLDYRSFEGSALQLELSGGSKVDLAGKVSRLTLEASGSAKLAGGMLSVEELNARMSGSAKVQVHVTSCLYVSASGSASLNVTGAPRSQRIKQSGAAKVRIKVGDV